MILYLPEHEKNKYCINIKGRKHGTVTLYVFLPWRQDSYILGCVTSRNINGTNIRSQKSVCLLPSSHIHIIDFHLIYYL